MFKVLTGYPDGTVAIRAEGRISGDDYHLVLEPAVKAAIAGDGRVRLLMDLGDGFEGYEPSAFIADGVFGTEEFRHVDRLAVVTDTPWVRHALALFGTFMPGHVRLYATAELATADAWIREA
jgi:hypothetical protein